MLLHIPLRQAGETETVTASSTAMFRSDVQLLSAILGKKNSTNEIISK